MQYHQVSKATFVSRINRFTAVVELNGKPSTVHLKTTARLGELLIDGSPCVLAHAQNPKRQTLFDLVAVQKGNQWINIDSLAPNKVFREWAENGGLGFIPSAFLSEVSYGNSRFDFYYENQQRKGFIEVKGVTLEREGIGYFPDAPTQRGLKHVHELMKATGEGYEAMICFILQMTQVNALRPNAKTDPAFAQALTLAQSAGVRLFALDCIVTPDCINVNHFIPLEY